MGRYIYQPIIMEKYSDQEYLKRYKQSIQTGEMLVDLQNYDIFVTEEGIELPIPITRNLREIVMSYIRSLKGDFNTRYLYLLQYADKIRQLKETIDNLNTDLRPNIISLDRSATQNYYRNIYFENLTLNNLRLAGTQNIDGNIFNAFKNSTGETAVLLDNLINLYKLFNSELTKINNTLANNTTINITSATNGLRGIYNDIQTINGILNDKMYKGNLGSASGVINLSKTIGSRELVTQTVDIYDFAYLNMAGSCSPGSVSAMDNYFATAHSCSTRA